MKALLILAALLSSFTAAWAQNTTADELRLIRREMEVLRQEQEAEAQRSAEQQKRDNINATLKSMEASREASAQIREQEQDHEAAETRTKQQQLSASLETLEEAQATRLLSEAEVRWLTNRISSVRERYRNILKHESDSRIKWEIPKSAPLSRSTEIFIQRTVWELPLFDRMVLIHSREKERWAQAYPAVEEPQIVEEAIPITPEANLNPTPQFKTGGGVVNARKRALMNQMER